MKHQKKAVKFLDSVDGIGALLFDPGVGKTGSTLAWVDKRLTKKYGDVRVLVVAPLTATDTWVLQAPPFMDSMVKARVLQGSTLSILGKIREARDWATVPKSKIGVDHVGNLLKNPRRNRVTILSMSSGAVSTWGTSYERRVKLVQAVRKYDPHLIVVDESHLIKSHNSNVSESMYHLGRLAPHRIILTGTVNPLSPLDCYGQWRFLAPWTFSDQYGAEFTKKPLKMTADQAKTIKPWPWGRFSKRYSVMGGYEGKQIVDVNETMISELKDRVAERSFVVNKEDALDLPPVVDIDVHIELTPTERKFYKEMHDDLAALLESGELLEAPNALAKMMKLRQVTAGFVKDTETKEIHTLGSTKRKAVAEIVNVQLAGEKRIVVFAYFKPECKDLAEALKANGRTVEVITGATKAKDRLAIRQRFLDVKGNPEQIVLVAQARTMSISVNELVTAQHAIYASLSERRDDWVQSRGRLDRNGQKGSKVTFWNVLAPGTIDEVMLKRHKDRGNMEAALLDHIKQRLSF